MVSSTTLVGFVHYKNNPPWEKEWTLIRGHRISSSVKIFKEFIQELRTMFLGSKSMQLTGIAQNEVDLRKNEKAGRGQEDEERAGGNMENNLFKSLFQDKNEK